MPGSGLGLAIVRQVMTRHGGTVTVDQAAAGGALVRIVIPGQPVPQELAPQVVNQP